MPVTQEALMALGLPWKDPGELPASAKRFHDGGQYRVEIPSVEGPAAFEAVVAAADAHAVRVHRISQGSGIMMQTDAEIEHMVAIGRQHRIEVCLFVGPRASWDIGVQASSLSGRVASTVLRGTDQLVYGIEDVRHGCDLGLRSILVADIGQLWVLAQMRRRGDLPDDLILKTSISLPAGNPAAARVLEDLGADTINLPVDLSLAQIAGIRAGVDAPIDVYVEAADDFGGPVRHYEVPELVRVGAPIHLKFTVRNAPALYPSGQHLAGAVVATAQERVRRASIGLSMLGRYYPEAIASE